MGQENEETEDKLNTLFQKIASKIISDQDDVQSLKQLLTIFKAKNKYFNTYSVLIGKVRQNVLCKDFINDYDFFRIFMDMNHFIIQTNTATKFEHNGRKVPKDLMGEYLFQKAFFEKRNNPDNALQIFYLSYKLGYQAALEYLVPLSIYCCRLYFIQTFQELHIDNPFMDQIISTDYAQYEQLLDKHQEQLIQQDLYLFYARGLLMIQAIALKNNTIHKLCEQFQNKGAIEQKLKNILVGQKIKHFSNVDDLFKPQKLEIFDKICDIVEENYIGKLQQIINQIQI